LNDWKYIVLIISVAFILSVIGYILKYSFGVNVLEGVVR
jgi:hypothetical protein